MELILEGTCWVFGDNIVGDIAVNYSKENKSIFDPEKLKGYCMIGYDFEFPRKAKTGDLLVAGRNFGSGHVHNQFPLSLKGAGIPAIIAESFARDFFRTIVNLGFPTPITCKEITRKAKQGDRLRVDLKMGEITNLTTGELIKITPLPEILIERIEAGGTKLYLKKKLASRLVDFVNKGQRALVLKSSYL